MWLNHTDRVSNVALSPDGTALGSCSWDGTMKASIYSTVGMLLVGHIRKEKTLLTKTLMVTIFLERNFKFLQSACPNLFLPAKFH